jgi:hypothetical protein
MPRFSPIKLLSRLAVIAVVGAAGLFGYQLLRADLAAEVYRERLEGLAGEYEALRGTFNEVVAKTAVTEILVREGRVSLRVADARGGVALLETPYTNAAEIHVDYVIVGGRLLIRRIYDEHTPPSGAFLVDAALADVDWDSPAARHGTTIYRALDEGRWVITVSANGSLDLSRAGEAETVELAAEPPVRQYDQIETEARRTIEGIGPGEVLRRLLGGERQP